MKKIISALGFIFILGAVGLFTLSRASFFEVSTNRSSETALIQDRLVELSDLTTLKYEYSNVIVSRTNRSVSLMGKTDIEFAEAIKLIEYSGYLKAGTDLSKVEVNTDKETEQVSVRVPHSQILDNVVETDKTTVEDVKGNVFSDYPTQVVFDEINENKKQLEEEKVQQGFLDEADERVASLLTSFLSSNGYNEVIIEFY